VHFLITTKATATAGLLGLGGGIGLALMTAKILPYIGCAVAVACAASVFWIYAKNLRAAYRAVANRIPYKGPPPRELLISNGAAIFLIVLSLWVLSAVIINAPPAGRAVLEAGIPEYVKIPSTATSGFLNVTFRNTGTLDAQNARILVSGRVAAKDIPSEILQKEMDSLADALRKFRAANIKAGLHPQIRTGSGAVITLESVTGDQWVSMAEGQKPSVGAISVSDDQWAAFQRGELAIYVLYVATYEDDGHAPPLYWHSSHCSFVRGAVNFSHNCADNRIDLRTGKR
jgi:hypothetical protein